jgi:signal transduction histidine kinase/DNA-binding response OmpR family regulator/integral membrane sensor domain MASE1
MIASGSVFPCFAAGRSDTGNCLESMQALIDKIAKRDAGESAGPSWHEALLPKQLQFALVFLGLFLLLDGSSQASQTWEGAPPCYLPVGLAAAVLLYGGVRYVPMMFLSTVVAAVVDYHRPLFSWCGLPGATLTYAGYIAGAEILRTRWRIDPKFGSLRDVTRFVITFVIAEVFSSTIGMLTLFADGHIQRADISRTAIDWATSDLIAIFTFTPCLLVYLGPRLNKWFQSEPQPALGHKLSWAELAEITAQAACVLLIIWLVFGLGAAQPYQPLYLLFVPVIWAAIRRGIAGATLVMPGITFGLTFAAWITKAQHGSLPRLQLAVLTIGLTSLCLGAIVSERRKAEAELRYSEAGLKEALKVARLGSWTLDPVTGRVTWTEELYRMMGFDPSLPAPNYSKQRESFVPESWQRLDACISETLRTGSSYELELETMHDGATSGWILARGEARRDEKGATKSICGIAQDITDRKRWEEELQSKSAFLEAQTNSTIDGVLVVDKHGRKLLQNQRLTTLFNIPQELMAQNDDGPMLSYVVSLMKDPKSFLQRVLYLYEHHEETSRDEIELTDGRVVDRYSSPVVGKDGEYYGRIWAFRDITEQKAAERELVKARESAEAANQAKSDFLANMSHEIRTPINGILGMADLLLDTRLTPEQRDDLQVLKSSGDSLLGVINDILDFSKIEAGKLHLDSIEFDLHNLISDTVRALALRAHQKGLELACSIPQDVPAMVVGDPGRLRQTLVNLMSNSVKFTEHGEVLLKVTLLSRTEKDLRLQFSIADTGIGIAPEKHALIFEAFAQADTSTTRYYGGSGLGLAICARLVEMMAGQIWVDSVPGKGSTFHFTASFGSAVGEQIAPVPCPYSELMHVPVIVVDDNSTNRTIVIEMTTSWGMEALAADGGTAALAIMRQARASGDGVRLAIIDGRMPGMDGFELAKQIRQDPQLAGAVIMMLTSTDQSGDAARCRELGIAAYLVKPIRKADLLAAIRTTLGAGALLPETGPTVRNTASVRGPGLRILLVEDNPVNQTVGLRMLEKMGHATALAKNGREALERIAGETFDLVFMDVQMPEMDGLTATGLIRAEEKTSGRHLPIVAMTARAMRGDRETCLAAGMDGYISKPIAREELELAIAEHSGKTKPPVTRREEGETVPEQRAETSWDARKFLEKIGGDESLLKEVTDIFFQETPKLILRLRSAIEAGDAGTVEKTAHTLKGELSYFGSEAANHARELERMGREKTLAEATATFASFERAVSLLMDVVKKGVRGRSAHA